MDCDAGVGGAAGSSTRAYVLHHSPPALATAAPALALCSSNCQHLPHSDLPLTYFPADGVSPCGAKLPAKVARSLPHPLLLWPHLLLGSEKRGTLV